MWAKDGSADTTGVTCGNVLVVSDTELTCDMPAGTGGAYSLVVGDGLSLAAATATTGHLAALLDALGERGGTYAATLHPRDRLRFAINQTMRGEDALVRPGDEVAIFPPVTGG